MSVTLLRFGLYIVLAAVVLYVLQQAYPTMPAVDYFPTLMLQKALALGGVLVIAGFAMRVLEKGAKVVTKNRCVVCKTPIPPGAIYCRAHLRSVLHKEEDRTHSARRT